MSKQILNLTRDDCHFELIRIPTSRNNFSSEWQSR